MRILWFVSSLEQKGGGERWALEAVGAIRRKGHDARIVCDRLSPAASFDGRYDLSDVICTKRDFDSRSSYFSRAASKAGGLLGLGRVIREQRPDMVFCQSEFDAIKLNILARFLPFKYRVFVFGQMFQFKEDITKYSSVFREHIDAIVASRPGYRETVLLPPPRLSLPVWCINELVSRLKRGALRASDRVFTLSHQVKWEVGLLYGCAAEVCRAAFDEDYIDLHAVTNPRSVSNPVRFLSVCRLVEKKRVDLIIRAHMESKLNSILTIVGSGPEDQKLRTLAADGIRSGSIRFLGSVSDEVRSRELAESDCFVSMDIGDFDISVVEAMGLGIRVIVAEDFDMSEFGADFSGAFTVSPSCAALSDAMRAVPLMAGPSARNLPALRRATWQHLAARCVDT
jgi:glycosyltransferase involved in cell wall biosynthesis